MTRHEFWREADSGEVWAVELEDGVVVRAHGPLHWSEITPVFLEEGYDYRAEDAEELEARREGLERLDEATVIQLAGSVD